MEETSRTNIKPEYWGRHGWAYLWAIALNFPEKATQEQRGALRRFLGAMGELLPCQKCRDHYQERHADGTALDAASASGAALRQWVLGLHNAIRTEQHGRPPLAEEDATQYFLIDSRPCASRSGTTMRRCHLAWIVPLTIVVAALASALLTRALG